MENKTNQPGRQQPSASAQDATSYEQDSARNQRSSSASNQSQSSMNASGRQQDQSRRQQQPQGSSQRQQQPQGSAQGGMLNNLTSGLSNVQVPQAVKDLGSNVARSFNSLTTTQKVIGGAAIALGASYWAASSQGWIGGQAKTGKRSKSSTGGTQHS